MNTGLSNPEWSKVASIAYDGFDERPFLVFWEITRACALPAATAGPRRSPDELDREESSRFIP